MVKKICILGSTGSIGQSSLEVISRFPERFQIGCLIAHRNIDLLEEQIRRFHPRVVGMIDEQAATELRRRIGRTTEVIQGENCIEQFVGSANTDIVISALVGFAGLRPTLAAIRHGKSIALANKEVLVAAGEIINRTLQESGARLIPIDSEHSAILQCLIGEDPSTVGKLILTASGGPFLHTHREQFEHITVEAALNHPNWKMGNKITIDSATLMNKGLEVIEAHWLFGVPLEKIEVLIHPQSVIHSMVEFHDGSIKAQLGIPDMKIPIQYALTYPERLPSNYRRVDFSTLGRMTFFAPDMEKFQCLRLAYQALHTGGTAPTIMNAANEVAVRLFLQKDIRFDQISKIIERSLDEIPICTAPSLEEIFEADRLTRRTIEERHSVFVN